ncbi:MAG TPA: protein translocase subunit SecF [Gemmatimonadales bacterium]|jgi:preprotein translocase subunit SecF
MVRIFANANYDFIGFRRKAIFATIALFVVGMIALIGWKLNYSVEFTGGTLMDVNTHSHVDVQQLRTALATVGLPDAEITPSANNQYLIRARKAAANGDPNNVSITGAAIGKALDQATGGHSNWQQNHLDAVGPKVGGELRGKAFLAIFLSFFAVLAYLAVRFEWRFGLAAVVATFHDIVLTICFIAVIRLEVSLVVVAAVLSMVGYSLNDTIVIFDRVRENMRKSRRDNLVAVLNESINETLPRSVLTHTTALASLAALAIFGGPVIRPFAVVMFFGVFTGTFSSIFIAAPVLLIIETKWPGIDGRKPRVSARVSPAARRPSTV